MRPSVSGYWTSAPARSAPTEAGSKEVQSPTRMLTPWKAARVRMTLMVWGWQVSATKKVFALGRAFRHMVTASAAAVPSSSREAFATGRPVREETMVWKFMSISRRPWAISG